jgi:membrane associated rhomboid family serine protease
MTFSKNGVSDRKRWVMLQSPGVNTATFGALIMVCIHLALILLWQNREYQLVDQIYLKGGLTLEGLTSGKIWQIITHSLLHGSWTHLATNVFLFYYAAARLSHVLSSWRIAGLFLLCTIGSALIHVLAQAIFPGLPRDPLVGASGGLMGMLLAFFALSPNSKMLLLPVSARNLGKGVLISSALLFLVTPGLNLPLMSNLGLWLEGAFGSILFQMAHLAHFIGGLLGWVMIPRFFPRLLTSEDLIRMRTEQELAAGSRCP